MTYKAQFGPHELLIDGVWVSSDKISPAKISQDKI
jgi:arginyl-tRNA--protein-N-Asp/Glu arginylyltransferase